MFTYSMAGGPVFWYMTCPGDFVRRMDVRFGRDHFRRRDDGTYVFKLSPFNESYPSLDNYTVVVTDSAFIPKSKYLYKDTKDVSVRIDRTPFFSPSGNYFGFTAIYGNTYYGLTADGIYRPSIFLILAIRPYLNICLRNPIKILSIS